jgi:hypothetical protein
MRSANISTSSSSSQSDLRGPPIQDMYVIGLVAAASPEFVEAFAQA